MELSMVQRRAVTNRLATKYRQASRSEKSEVLDQIAPLTGWHRDHCRAELRPAGRIRVAPPRKARQLMYSSRIIWDLVIKRLATQGLKQETET